jgi:hypothetical protein
LGRITRRRQGRQPLRFLAQRQHIPRCKFSQAAYEPVPW